MSEVIVSSLGQKYGPDRPEVWVFDDAPNNAWYEVEADTEQEAIDKINTVVNPPPPPEPVNVVQNLIDKLVEKGTLKPEDLPDIGTIDAGGVVVTP